MKKVIYGVLSFAPVLAFAAVDLSNINGILNFIKTTVATLIPIMFGLAIVYFFWGLIEYIRAAGDPKKAAEGRSIMIWGVIAIAVMASIYGLVAWLQGATGVNPNAAINIPVVPGL
ncbi:MAG: hypothetical protein WAX37_02185 [Minisyncoccia bacterium]